jgi:hypothetical protein
MGERQDHITDAQEDLAEMEKQSRRLERDPWCAQNDKEVP